MSLETRFDITYSVMAVLCGIPFIRTFLVFILQTAHMMSQFPVKYVHNVGKHACNKEHAFNNLGIKSRAVH